MCPEDAGPKLVSLYTITESVLVNFQRWHTNQEANSPPKSQSLSKMYKSIKKFVEKTHELRGGPLLYVLHKSRSSAPSLTFMSETSLVISPMATYSP